MNAVKRTAAALLCALAISVGLLWAAPAARAETVYEDGTYTVAFSIDGLGRHNIAWDTATVHIKGGVLTVDFTLERVDPRNHAPQYDWLTTSCGKYYPVLDDAAYTCTFSGVQVPHLGAVSVVAYSAPMATEIDYTLHIDDSAIPRAAAQTDPQPAQQSEPVAPEETSDDPANEDDTLVTGATPVDDDMMEILDLDDAAEDGAVLTTGEAAEVSSGGLSPLVIAAICVGGAVLIGGVYALVRSRKGKNHAA